VASEEDDPSGPLACARLFALAAHELRTPVSVVAGYLRILQRDGSALTGTQREILQKAETSCDRLAALVGQLSEIAAIDTGTASFANEPFDLFELVHQAAGAVDKTHNERTEVSVDGEARGAHMTGDSVRLRHAFTTFLNAMLRERQTAPAITIDRRLGGSGAAREAIIVVAEASDVAGALGAPREPIDESRGGHGLSLPIARRVIERHGGRVWSAAVPPAAPGRGPFVVSVPARGSHN
jgi:signal transduction histidine kinase